MHVSVHVPAIVFLSSIAASPSSVSLHLASSLHEPAVGEPHSQSLLLLHISWSHNISLSASQASTMHSQSSNVVGFMAQLPRLPSGVICRRGFIVSGRDVGYSCQRNYLVFVQSNHPTRDTLPIHHQSRPILYWTGREVLSCLVRLPAVSSSCS